MDMDNEDNVGGAGYSNLWRSTLNDFFYHNNDKIVSLNYFLLLISNTCGSFRKSLKIFRNLVV